MPTAKANFLARIVAIKNAIATITGASAPNSELIKRFVFDPNDDNWVALLKANNDEVDAINIYYDGIDQDDNADTPIGCMDPILPFGFVFYQKYRIGTDTSNSEEEFMARIAAVKWDLAVNSDLGLRDDNDPDIRNCVANHRGLRVPKFGLKVFNEGPVHLALGQLVVEMQSQYVRGG